MGGQGLGDRQDRTIGGWRKASEIEKKHAIGASPIAGTSTSGRRELVARTLQQVEGSLTTRGRPNYQRISPWCGSNFKRAEKEPKKLPKLARDPRGKSLSPNGRRMGER
jgi:hypothetical protein